jgi:hypothetical protein
MLDVSDYAHFNNNIYVSGSIAAGTTVQGTKFIGDVDAGDITANSSIKLGGYIVATQSWVGSQGYLTGYSGTSWNGNVIGTAYLPTAAADGSTKGIAAFNASDFNSSSGVISLDYLNMQVATTSVRGLLTSADWNTFNNKLDAVNLQWGSKGSAYSGNMYPRTFTDRSGTTVTVLCIN